MNCVSCKQPIAGGRGEVFNRKLILCHPCNEKALAMNAKLEALYARSRQQLFDWFEQLILDGGLLREAVKPPDIDPRSSGGDLPPSDQ